MKNKLFYGIYYIYSFGTLVLLSLLTYLNLLETTDQFRGKLTAFNQLSTLTVTQIQNYCVFSTCIIAILTICLIRFLILHKHRKVLFTASLGWIVMIGMYVFENSTNYSI